MRRLFGALIGLVVLIVLLAAAVFVFRLVRQGAIETRIRIETPGGIEEAAFVDINGERQWVQIRGQDTTRPIVLFLAGGPGSSMIPITQRSDLAWERDFVMVHWDQPGAGKTMLENKGAEKPLTIARMADDGVAVADYVSKKFGGRKIILLGHSWGSLLGLEMARKRPDLFAAFVGTGQVVDLDANESIGYARLVQRLTDAGKTKDLAALASVGPPPYTSQDELLAERKILSDNPLPSERSVMLDMAITQMLAAGYSLPDAYAISRTSPDASLINDLLAWKARNGAMTFAMPIIIIQGAEDIQTPTELVAPLLDDMTAPSKQLILIPGGGHFAIVAKNAEFLAAFKTALAAAAH